jgi:hypothetical protein
MEIVDMKHYYRKHAHETVFMIGNGPSLTYEMLDKLQGHKTIAMNNIAVAFPHTDWRPTYYLNVTRSFQYDAFWQDRGIEAINEAECSFLWAKNIMVPLRRGADARIVIMSCIDIPVWFMDQSDCVSRYGSSMFSALQIAHFMGFDQLFLVGCDLGYQKSAEAGKDVAHFTEEYLGPKWIKHQGIGAERLLRDEIRTYDAHAIAAPTLRAGGRHIFTCSRGPLLRIYDHVPFEEALVRKRNYYG